MSLNYDELATTTIEKRSKKLADNITKSRALLYRLRQKGKKMPFDGGRVILQELEYAENGTFGFYSGWEPIDMSPQTVMTSAEFPIKQAAGSFVISGLEMIQNAGESQMINLMSARQSNLEKTFKNKIGEGLYSLGTGWDGKQVDGLQRYVPDNPAVGVVGGIDASIHTWWRSQKFAGVADGGAAVSGSNILRYVNKLYLDCKRDSDSPDLAVFDNNFYEFLLEAVQSRQVMTDPKMAEVGFTNIVHLGMTCVADGGQGGACPANHAYLLNTDYIYYRPAVDRDMTVLRGDRVPFAQDGLGKIIVWAGNVTISNRALQGVLIA